MTIAAKQAVTNNISPEEEALKIENELYFYERRFKEYVVSLFNPVLDKRDSND